MAKVIVNEFGKENTSYITDHDLRNFLSTHFRGIQRLIRFIHFNDEHIENHNIKPTPSNSTTIDVYLDGNTMSLNKEYVLDTLIMDAWKRLVAFYEKLEEDGDLDDFLDTLVSQETIDRIQQFVKTYRSICDGENIAHKDLHDDVYEMIKFQSLKFDKSKKKTTTTK